MYSSGWVSNSLNGRERDERLLVSVITPSYNQAQYIRQTIESVLAQDYPYIEHIVVDGASTDGTVEILREYGAKYPDRFRWISEKDKGQSDAFNKGLSMARGELIGWQNSDDYYLPRAISALVEGHRGDDVTVVFGDCDVVDERGRYLSRCTAPAYTLSDIVRGSCIPNQSALVKRTSLVAVGGLCQELHYVMDYNLWLHLAARYPIRRIDGVHACFRAWTGGKTVASHYASWAERVEALLAFYDTPFADQCLPKVRSAGLVSAAARTAVEYLADSELAKAKKYLDMASSLNYDYIYNPQQFSNELLAAAVALDVPNIIAFAKLNKILRNASAIYPDFPQLRGAALSRWHALCAFGYRSTNDTYVSLASAYHAFQYDRSWITQRRDLTSAACNKVFGQFTTQLLGRLVRGVGYGVESNG